jgi:hypothetical protein
LALDSASEGKNDLSQENAVTRAQVVDNERTLSFQLGQFFINVQLAQSPLDLAQRDVQQAQLAITQALPDLRQQLGYESLPAEYEVTGPFE